MQAQLSFNMRERPLLGIGALIANAAKHQVAEGEHQRLVEADADECMRHQPAAAARARPSPSAAAWHGGIDCFGALERKNWAVLRTGRQSERASNLQKRVKHSRDIVVIVMPCRSRRRGRSRHRAGRREGRQRPWVSAPQAWLMVASSTWVMVGRS